MPSVGSDAGGGCGAGVVLGLGGVLRRRWDARRAALPGKRGESSRLHAHRRQPWEDPLGKLMPRQAAGGSGLESQDELYEKRCAP